MDIDRRYVEIDGKRYEFDSTEDCPCHIGVYGGEMCTHPSNERLSTEVVKKCRFFFGVQQCPARLTKDRNE